MWRLNEQTGRLFDNRIPIHQIHSLCGCNKRKRVQRCAMTRRKAVSEKIPAEHIGQLPIPPRPTKRTMILPSSHIPKYAGKMSSGRFGRSPSSKQSAAGNGGGSVRPTVRVQLPWRQFAADRLATSLAFIAMAFSGCLGQIENAFYHKARCRAVNGTPCIWLLHGQSIPA